MDRNTAEMCRGRPMEPRGIEPLTSCLQTQRVLLPSAAVCCQAGRLRRSAARSSIVLLPSAAVCRFHKASTSVLARRRGRRGCGAQLVRSSVSATNPRKGRRATR